MMNLPIGNFEKFSFNAFGKANVAALNGKTVGENEWHNKISTRAVRDELTLSRQERCTYGKPVSRLDKTEQSTKPAEFIPQLTLNPDGTATLTNADGSTTLLQPDTIRREFTPAEGEQVITGTILPQAVSDAMTAYREFYEHVRQELSNLLPSNSEVGDFFSRPSTITQNIFAMAGQSTSTQLAVAVSGKSNEEMVALAAEFMTNFSAFQTQVTQGLQDLREIIDIRARLAFAGDGGMFSRPLNDGWAGHKEIAHIVLGTNEVLFDRPSPFGGQIMARGQDTDLAWLRQVDKVATREGLQAAFARENQPMLGADGRGTTHDLNFAYYDWEKGTQTLIKITLVNSLDGGRTFIQNDQERPFTITVTEYSLKDPRDKGKVLGQASGTDYFAWLGSSDNFLPHIGSEGFQEWRTNIVERSAEWGWQSFLGISNSARNTFSQLGQLLGLEGSFTNRTSLLHALNKRIDEEGKELNKLLSDKLHEAGMGDVTKKVTFAEDKDGNIVIEGNISARQKRQLARMINGDSELVERIKTQKARMEIAEELARDDADLSDKRFDAARTQLLNDFLMRHGTSLEEYDAANDGNLDVARAVAGQKSIGVTQVYNHADLKIAIEQAKKRGKTL